MTWAKTCLNFYFSYSYFPARVPIVMCSSLRVSAKAQKQPHNNKAQAQMRRGRRRRQNGCPWQDDRSSVVSPHSQVRGACGGPGWPHIDRWSEGHCWLLSCPRAEISQTDTFPFLQCVMLGSGGNITITYSRKYVLEREKAEPAYWLT